MLGAHFNDHGIIIWVLNNHGTNTFRWNCIMGCDALVEVCTLQMFLLHVVGRKLMIRRCYHQLGALAVTMCWRILSKCVPFKVLLSSAVFKAPAVGHGPQQPPGPEPCSFSARLQQFWGGVSTGTLSDTCSVCSAVLCIQLWRLWPSAVGRGAAQDLAPQHRLLHGMERTTCLCIKCPHRY